LWEFLGVKGLFQVVGGGLNRLRNRLGSRFPGLEARPPVLALTDPANMGPNAPPAVKAAADAKAYEDQAAQKIKAIRYLATLGCTECFPDVETGLLAALDDCTESVRYEAVLAIRTLAGSPCAQCLNNRCCSPSIRAKLEQMANQTNNMGCYVEPSARVRRVARLALAGCGGATATASLPIEGPADMMPTPDPSIGPVPAMAIRRIPPPPPEQVATASVLRASNAGPPIPSASRAVLAEANGEPIFEDDVLPRVQLAAAGGDGQSSPLFSELVRVIDRKLVCQAARRAGFAGSSGSPLPVDPERTFQQVSFDAPVDEEQYAAEWLRAVVRFDTVVSRQEIFHFYRQHLHHFQPAAQVRFEHLSAATAQFGSPQQAEMAIRYFRDRAQRLPVSSPSDIDLSRVSIQTHDWISRDQIESPELAHCLFSQEVGMLSPILYDDTSAYVVRVLERRQARAVPLEEAADAITREILTARRVAAERAYVEELRRAARVWTVLDGPRHQVASGGAW
jgi:hypothetical protein